MQSWLCDLPRTGRLRSWIAATVLLLTAPPWVLAAGGCGGTGEDTAPTPGVTTDAGADAPGDVTVDIHEAQAPDSDNEAAADADAGPGECVPKTCATLGANCGTAPDGCGGEIKCGACPNGQTCGGGGPNSCGTAACVPKGCAQAGASCGLASDGCADVIDCGGCPSPMTCGGLGQLNQCGCSPKTCAQLDANCGTLPDGCTDVVDCGPCPSGQSCGGAGANQCGADTCAPKTCSQVNASCGFVSDGCSAALDCGQCPAPDECGGGGVANQCGCTPKSCAELGVSCGTVDNGCASAYCGDCLAPDTCGGGNVEGQCGCLCTLPHAVTDCLQGVCSIRECEPGWGDCDADASTGCETDLTSSLGHCGACGQSCALAHADATCEHSACVLVDCAKGYGDCDGDPATGCETHIQIDLSHCGGCGLACNTSDIDCDAPDLCDAGQCVSRFKTASTLCRAAGADASCDPAEYCSGSSAACPANAVAETKTSCGSPDATGCNAADSCDGAGHCVDRLQPSGTVCRIGKDGQCDPTEVCTGASAVCPADTVANYGTPCGSSSNLGCDAADSCDGAGSCIARFKPALTVCRGAGANATCDPAERCSEASAVCPGDGVAPKGTPCPPGSSCDGAGTCCDAAYGTGCIYYTIEEAWGCSRFQSVWCSSPGQSLYSITQCHEDQSFCDPLPDEKCFVQCLHAWDGVVGCDGACGP